MAPCLPLGGAPVSPHWRVARARGATTDRHLEVVGAKPPRGRPPSAHPRGGWRRAGRCSQLLSDAKHSQHPRNGFWLGVSWAKSVEFSKVKQKIMDRYTSHLAIHYAIVAQGQRNGSKQLLVQVAIANIWCRESRAKAVANVGG
jgi:hypothetical protein